MWLPLNKCVQSPEDFGYVQPRTDAHNGSGDARVQSTLVGSRHVIDLDAETQCQIVSEVALSTPRLGQVSCPGGTTDAADILSERCSSEPFQLRKTGPLDQSNERHISGVQVKSESITDVETSKILRSIREDILSEIRSLKVILLEEIRHASNHVAYNPTTTASASPPKQLAASNPEHVVDMQDNMNATQSDRSVTMPDCTDIRRPSVLSFNSVKSDLSVNRAKSGGGRKSIARLHDEAILEDWRQQRRAFANSGRTTSEAIKTSFQTSNSRNLLDGPSFYSEIGVCQKVAKHYLFENVTLAVIVLNAFWMSVDADLNDDSITHAPLPYVLADVMFYTYYVGEILVRFLAIKHKVKFYKDVWFVFDLALVILYTLDPFVLGIIQYARGKDSGSGFGLSTESLRLFRLVRLFRLTRLLRHVPDLLILIKGIVTALASVSYTSGLLALITYVFAVALRNTVPADSEIETQYFPNVFETMHHLIIYGAFVDDLSSFILDVKAGSVACFMLSWLYIFLAHLMIMNVLIGIVCEVMAMVANDANESTAAYKVNDKFLKLLNEFDGNEEGRFGWEEFAQFLETSSCQDALNKFDIDVDVLVDMVEDQFFCSDFEGGAITISFTQIIELIVNLRGSKSASVKDVMVIGRRLNTKFREMNENLEDFVMLIHGSKKSR